MTLNYDDFILNDAAEQVKKLFETYIIPFFSKYEAYESLERTFNKTPIEQLSIAPFFGKGASHGILLARLFDRADFEFIVSSYRNYANQLHHLTRNEMVQCIEKH
jgi:hypothetical protein